MFPSLLILGLIVLSFVVLLGITLGVGWVLTLLLPLSLFEGAMITMLLSAFVWTIWRSLFQGLPDWALPELDHDLDDEDYAEADLIPPQRFYETEAGKTWENWFRFVFANAIYEDFLSSLRGAGAMRDQEKQELAIRLADTMIAILKKRSPRSKRLKINVAALRQELLKEGLQPYDEDILDVALEAVNWQIEEFHEDLREIIAGRRWTERMLM